MGKVYRLDDYRPKKEMSFVDMLGQLTNEIIDRGGQQFQSSKTILQELEQEMADLVLGLENLDMAAQNM